MTTYTRTGLKAEIIDDLERDATLDSARVLSAISAAIRHYQPRRFYFNETRSVTFTTTASKATYTFGSGGDIATVFYAIDGAYITQNTTTYELRRLDYQDTEVLQDSSPSNGLPYAYSYIGQSIILYPPPNGTYTMRLTGHIQKDEPASDDQAGNVWMTEAYDLIRARAKFIFLTHTYPDTPMAAIMKGDEREALSALRAATTAKTATGRITPTAF